MWVGVGRVLCLALGAHSDRYVGKKGKRLIVRKDGEVLAEARLKETSQLVLCGNIGISAQSLLGPNLDSDQKFGGHPMSEEHTRHFMRVKLNGGGRAKQGHGGVRMSSKWT